MVAPEGKRTTSRFGGRLAFSPDGARTAFVERDPGIRGPVVIGDSTTEEYESVRLPPMWLPDGSDALYGARLRDGRSVLILGKKQCVLFDPKKKQSAHVVGGQRGRFSADGKRFCFGAVVRSGNADEFWWKVAELKDVK